MTDEEAFEHMPAVIEFLAAVEARDELTVWACLQHTPAATLAVWCAELLAEERRANEGLRGERAEVSHANRRLIQLVQVKTEKINELRGILDAAARNGRKAA